MLRGVIQDTAAEAETWVGKPDSVWTEVGYGEGRRYQFSIFQDQHGYEVCRVIGYSKWKPCDGEPIGRQYYKKY